MRIVLSGVAVSSPAFLSNRQTWRSKRGRTKNPNIPMRLLCLGLGRTGTISLRIALAELGYRPYHGYSLIENPPDSHLWKEALDAKFEAKGSKKWSGRDFDQIFADVDACLDVPTSLFAEEFIEAYPEAKVLVTTRDLDSWYRSWEETIAQTRPLFERILFSLLVRLDRASSLYIPVMDKGVRYQFKGCFNSADSNAAKAIYNDHIEVIKRKAPDCLLYDVKEGWEPLCEFLDKKTPRTANGEIQPFPNANSREEWNTMWRSLTLRIVRRRLMEIALWILAVFVPLGSVYWASHLL